MSDIKIVFDKSTRDFILKAVGLENNLCQFCNSKLTDGVGLITKNIWCCNSPLCISEALDKIKELEGGD